MSTPQQSDLDALVLAAQEGDKDAFAELYDHFFEKIYRYVYFRVQSSEVDDIVETVFIKAWTKLEKYTNHKDASFGAWLFRIAHNTVIDHRRAHRSLMPIDPRMEDRSRRSAPASRASESMMAEQVRAAVRELREPYRQVVTLKFLTGLSNSEIAQVLGRREGNVRVLQYRALKELKQMLTERGLSAEFL